MGALKSCAAFLLLLVIPEGPQDTWPLLMDMDMQLWPVGTWSWIALTSPLLCPVPEAAAGCETLVPALGEDALETAQQWDFGVQRWLFTPASASLVGPRSLGQGLNGTEGALGAVVSSLTKL